MSRHQRTHADENSQVPHHMPALLQRQSSSFLNTFSTSLTNINLQTPSPTSSFEFVDAFTPVPKRRKLHQIAAEDSPKNTGIVQDPSAAAESRREQEKRLLEDEENKGQDCLNQALKLVEGVGYPTLYASPPHDKESTSIFASVSHALAAW